MACGELGRAVELLEGDDGERTAASAWYALRFVQDLVGMFGPIVSVPDPRVRGLGGAGAGAVVRRGRMGDVPYTVYVRRGDVEELVFPGRFSRSGPISEGTYAEALRENGWRLKDRGSG